MKRPLKLLFLLGGITLFTVGCQLPFTKKIVTLPLLEKSPTKVAQLNKEKTAAITTSHIEMTADIMGKNTSVGAAGDMSGTFTLKADSDVPGKKMKGSLTGTISAANASYNFGLDLRSLNDVFYFQLTALPSLPGAASNALSGITNVWYRVDPAELQNSLSNSLGSVTSLLPETAVANTNLNVNSISNTNRNANTNSNLNANSNRPVNSNANLNLNATLNANKQEEILNRITNLAKNSNVYSLGERLADEKITGVNCYHYKITNNQAEFRKLLEEIMGAESDLLRGVTGFGGTSVDPTGAVVDEAMKMLNNMNGEIWIGKKDFLTHKVKFDLTTTQEAQTLTVKISLVSSNFNQPVTVEAPAESKSFTELLQTVMTMLFGITTSSSTSTNNDWSSDELSLEDVEALGNINVEVSPLYDDIIQIDQLSTIKESLALYHAETKEYPTQLSKLATWLETQCANHDMQLGAFVCRLKESFTDVDYQTKAPYPYNKTGDSYTLIYRIKDAVPGQTVLKEPMVAKFVVGENTMTPDSLSLEADPKLDKDTDGDGLIDKRETKLGLEADNSDTDGDGYKDGYEILRDYNPAGSGEYKRVLQLGIDSVYK